MVDIFLTIVLAIAMVSWLVFTLYMLYRIIRMLEYDDF